MRKYYRNKLRQPVLKSIKEDDCSLEDKSFICYGNDRPEPR